MKDFFRSPKRLLFLILVVLLGIVAGLVIYGVTSLGPLRSVLPKVAEITGVLRGDRHYLILLQNNAELRPTGGFITAFAELDFRGGIPTGITIRDVYSLKGHNDDILEEAPYPMGDMLAGPTYTGHSFHDANWFPDVPTSVQELLRFYDMEFPDRQVDGVILVNFTVVEDLIKLLGSLPYQGKELPANELFHTIEHEQNNIDRHNIDDITNRKGILSELMPVFLKRLTADIGRLPEISEHIAAHLDAKNITVWMKDQSLQDFFAQKGWTNNFPAPSSQRDIFAVVMANLGGMKSDRYLEKHFDHAVRIERVNESTSEMRLVASTSVDITHMGTMNAPLSHVYRGFLRLMIPKEAKLLEVDPAQFDIYEEGGYTIVGRKLSLEPEENIRYTINYELPGSFFTNNQYTLAVYKQSGMERATYTSHLTTPSDQLITSSDFDVTENVATFRTSDLHTDQLLEATVGEDTTPPRVSFQEFVDYNRITIQFNEAVQKSDCENSDNYEVMDTDKKVPTLTNTPRLLRVTCKDKEATIYTQNIRTQYGEHFTVRMRNLRDWSNNIISPNPREITVVQRFDKDKPSEE